jgi:hypothetical protein
MNKDNFIILLIASVIAGLLLFSRLRKNESRNEEANETSEMQHGQRNWPLPKGRAFSGVAVFLGLFFTLFATICFCGGPEGQFGSISSIMAGLVYSVIAGGLFYYSFG